MRVVYPGSFDPFTVGHLNIVKRASKLFEKVYVAVAEDTAKTCVASLQQRTTIATECLKDIKNVEVVSFSGLTSDFAIKNACRLIVRGVRGVLDIESEKNLSKIYRSQGDVEIIALFSDYEHISSSLVRELGSAGGDLSSYVCASVLDKVNKIYKR